MAFIISFFIVVGIVMLLLSIALAVTFIRLGRELRQMSEDINAASAKFSRSARLLQLSVPVFIIVRTKVRALYSKVRSLLRKESL